MKDTQARVVIILVSVVVPAVIGYLLYSVRVETSVEWIYMLPHVNAVLNACTALVLVTGLIMIKRGNIEMHRISMLVAFTMAALFFISYLTYHASVPSQMYGDLDHDQVLSSTESLQVEDSKALYLSLLLSHIVLAVVLVPLVLFAFYFALTSRIEAHKKVVRFAWPVWFYVSVSGVVVYTMISPFY